MSHTRNAAPVSSAALFTFLLLLPPAFAFARPDASPPLSPPARAGLANAAEGRALLPWQRQFMRGLAAQSPAPVNPVHGSVAHGAWSELPPPSQEDARAIYDPVRQSMLIFGGADRNKGYSNDLWELSLSGTPTWTLLQPSGIRPSPRSAHVLLYDSRRERMLLFGGADSITHNDFWTLDLTVGPPAWAQGLPSGSLPSRRAYGQAVYDSLNDRVVLFGGADSLSQNTGPVGMRGDIWVLPLTGPLSWSPLAPTGTPPSARAAGAAIYDRARQRMVLFGGYDGNPIGDAFTLSLGGSPAWAPLGATGGPPAARAIPGVIYDAPQDRMVIFGGFSTLGSLNDVWKLDLAAPAWTELAPTGGPPSVRQSAMAEYDAARNRMVVFGGSAEGTGGTQDPLWALSLGASIGWTDLGSHHPLGRWDAATAVDPTRQRMWIHGGDAYGNLGRATRTDLWSIPLGSPTGWSEPATTGTPLGRRFGHSAVYDALRDRLVFFGGSDTVSAQNDTWALTLSGTPAWSQLSPGGTPPSGRLYHSAVYDAVNDRMVIFGGITGSTSLNDVWALSFAGSPTWSQIFPTGTPPQNLWTQSGALDRGGNRLIIFGGRAGTLRNDVHALTLTGSPNWSELFPTGTPPSPRRSAAMASLGSRMLVFGGTVSDTGSVGINDTWLLSLYPTPSWQQLDVGTLLPPARYGSSGGFDQATFRFSVFGGADNYGQRADTWVLQLNELVPTLASLVSATAEPGRVSLTWEIAPSLAAATVYRSQGGGTWTALGRVTPDGTRRLAYVDREVIGGLRYGYRLGLPGESGEVFAAEVWVEVPEAARFALRGVMPNPGPAGAGLITFSLPDAAPAQLEVMDVSGRRVFSREVGSLGRGEHVLRVSGAEPLGPGLYLVRLTRAGRSLTVKAVTLP